MITMNYSICMDAARDKGNRNMRKNGRTQWNIDDWDAAAKELDRVDQYRIVPKKPKCLKPFR